MSNIKQTHPQLHGAFLLLGFENLAIGLCGLANPKPNFLTSIPFIVLGILLLLGVKLWRFPVLHKLTIASFMYSLFYAAALIAAFALTINNPETRRFLTFLPLWLGWTFTHFLILKEPPINPATTTRILSD